MRGYKVLTAKRRSCIAIIKNGGLYYPVGVAVKPKKGWGPLCVFQQKERAEEFAKYFVCGWPNSNGFIAKCEYEPSLEYAVWRQWGFPSRWLGSLPEGTALATTVTCLE